MLLLTPSLYTALVQGLQTGWDRADVQSAGVLHSVMLPPPPDKERWKSGLMERFVVS